MAVLVPTPTGVGYRHQYGGTACPHGGVGGYYVPVHDRAALAELRSLFEETLGGAGASRRLPATADLLGRLRDAVGRVRMAPSGGLFSSPALPLALDDSRLSGANEAWLPVTTLDGPGVLIWPNSD